MPTILKLPRNVIENDPSWLRIPSESPGIVSWINNGLNFTAKCESNGVVCEVFPNSSSEPLLPNLISYIDVLNSGNGRSSEIRKYLSSIYLNPNQMRPRLFGKTKQVDIFRLQ